MNLIRFNPFAEVTSLRDQINRLFDEASLPRGEREGNAGTRVWGPAVDIAEGENEVTVFIDVPGVNRQSIDVQLTGDTLTVRGERQVERPEGQNVLHVERPYGQFVRSFTIGVAVQTDQVQASYRDGVLTIVLPKAEAVKPRKIQIQADNEQAGG
jgi:HSP20 family protein